MFTYRRCAARFRLPPATLPGVMTPDGRSCASSRTATASPQELAHGGVVDSCGISLELALQTVRELALELELELVLESELELVLALELALADTMQSYIATCELTNRVFAHLT